jgi:hypothetical protein
MNITSLFDLVSLLNNTYGRLSNDRPREFKFDGSYCWRFKLNTSASFRAQSGIPFDALIPHPAYLDNEGLAAPRPALPSARRAFRMLKTRSSAKARSTSSHRPPAWA